MTYSQWVTLGLLVVPLAGGAARGDLDRAGLKPRIVVTTDPELDDANSLIRYLLFGTPP